MEKATLKIRGLFLEEVKALVLEAGEQPYRGSQLFHWVQAKAAENWEEMTNLSRSLRDKLSLMAELRPLILNQERVSKDGTRKYLWQLSDGLLIESVLLYHGGDITKDRYTLCLSSQVGCPMGCGFCATGKIGYKRNLRTDEIISQVLDTTALMRRGDPGFKIGNLVYMGMGEPLLNLPAVIKSIKILNHKDGQNIGIRRITISTCGLVPQIDELADQDLDIVLAVSLHAPNNALRDALMPVNRQYPLEKLLTACRRYTEKTGRRITMEYALMEGFNDSPSQAEELGRLLSGLSANVNIIPVNESSAAVNNEGVIYRRPAPDAARRFLTLLKEQGLNAVIREEKGSDIQAACGQLAGACLEQAHPCK